MVDRLRLFRRRRQPKGDDMDNEGIREFTEQELEHKYEVLTHAPDHPRLAPPDVELLKKTRGMCPTCHTVIDADVGVEDDAVFIYKRCAEHGDFKAMVEPHVGFYKATMNTSPVAVPPVHTLILPVTHRCNLDCALCYVPKRGRDDLSFEQIKQMIEGFDGKVIALSGGEPTLRKDICEIIQTVSRKGKECRILTNAIKLADRDFVQQLTDAGLRQVLFSFNGFTDEVYEATNRKPLLEIKLAALQNCAEAGLEVVVSPTIFRDLNEADVAPLIKLCLENPCVVQLRLRGAARVGRHGKFAPLATSELVQLIADAVDRPIEQFLAEFERDKVYHSIAQFNMLAAFDSHAKGAPFYDWNSGEWYKERSDYDQSVKRFQRKVCDEAGRYIPISLFGDRFKFLQLYSWGWPDVDTMDFQEVYGTGIHHIFKNDKPMNFFEAVLRAESL